MVKGNFLEFSNGAAECPVQGKRQQLYGSVAASARLLAQRSKRCDSKGKGCTELEGSRLIFLYIAMTDWWMYVCMNASWQLQRNIILYNELCILLMWFYSLFFVFLSTLLVCFILHLFFFYLFLFYLFIYWLLRPIMCIVVLLWWKMEIKSVLKKEKLTSSSTPPFISTIIAIYFKNPCQLL